MTFSMKDEEFFERYIAQAVKPGEGDSAKAVVAKLFAAVNTEDMSKKDAADEFIPEILSYVRENAVNDTKIELEKLLGTFEQ